MSFTRNSIVHALAGPFVIVNSEVALKLDLQIAACALNLHLLETMVGDGQHRPEISANVCFEKGMIGIPYRSGLGGAFHLRGKTRWIRCVT